MKIFGAICLLGFLCGISATGLWAQMTVNQDGSVTVSGKISAPDPTASGNLATKNYVDNADAATKTYVDARSITASGTSSSSSWVKFADGTMMEYGNTTVGGASAQSNYFGSAAGTVYSFDATVTFPQAFLTGTMPSCHFSSDNVWSGMSNRTVSATQAVFRIYDNSSSAPANHPVYWLAIGRWK